MENFEKYGKIVIQIKKLFILGGKKMKKINERCTVIRYVRRDAFVLRE